MPIAIGGTHIQAYGLILALAQKYGPKSFVLVHVDAHYDALTIGLGPSSTTATCSTKRSNEVWSKATTSSRSACGV